MIKVINPFPVYPSEVENILVVRGNGEKRCGRQNNDLPNASMP